MNAFHTSLQPARTEFFSLTMFVADYVQAVKKYFKRKISNDELCEILFDAIIIPADLRNRNGEILTVDKADISRILNRKKNLPNALRKHVWDKSVQNSIDKYFETKIVAELVPDTSDLIYRLMNLIEADENISPARKTKLRNMSKESPITFLKEVFVYTLRQENKLSRTTSVINTPNVNRDNRKLTVRQNSGRFFNLPASYIAAVFNATALYGNFFSSPYYQTFCRAIRHLNH